MRDLTAPSDLTPEELLLFVGMGAAVPKVPWSLSMTELPLVLSSFYNC